MATRVKVDMKSSETMDSLYKDNKIIFECKDGGVFEVIFKGPRVTPKDINVTK